MKKILIISSLIFLSHIVFSQENIDSNNVETKNTTIVQDYRITKLSESYSDSYQLKGYRVQIFSGNKKQPANQARSTFLRVHPKTKAHLTYGQPYYKVRVGDFKTKLEALKYKKGIIDEFPNCFIVEIKTGIDINEIID